MIDPIWNITLDPYVLYREGVDETTNDVVLHLVDRFKTYDKAEKVAVESLCLEDRHGTFLYQIHRLDGWQEPDGLTMVGKVQRQLDLLWRGNPADWTGSNGESITSVCGDV